MSNIKVKKTWGINEIRNEYIQMAKDLCYPKKYIERIKTANSEDECIRLMKTARDSLN